MPSKDHKKRSFYNKNSVLNIKAYICTEFKKTIRVVVDVTKELYFTRMGCSK